MRTTDGGRTWAWWASGSDPPVGDGLPAAEHEFPVSFQFENFSFTTPNTGIVAGCGGASVTDDGALN